MLAWYRRLIALRQEQPDLTDPDLADTKVAYDADARWLAFRRGDVRVAVNLGRRRPRFRSAPAGWRSSRPGEPVQAPGPDGLLQVPGESCVVLTQP
ncbi:DUF3459 domain-containing protein [Streptomyces tricolor]|nr:DUF3459 domain-containing protein [Streptomyces tricolor]